jgi:aminoglycoside phosphotransferase (APT) family kinase protein
MRNDIPPAVGVRRDWSELPPRIRAAVETRLGSPVVLAATQPGGFSPGVAARLRTADGQRIFLKAVGPEPLAFEDVDGRHPALPWRADDLARVLDAIRWLSAALTPSPVSPALAAPAAEWFDTRGRGWTHLLDECPDGLDAWSARRLGALAGLEAMAAEAASGDTLLHFDVRADNLLLTDSRVLVVDWPHARVGAAWIDFAFFAPSVAMQGGPPPEDLLAQHPASHTADPSAVTSVVSAIAGFFTWQALQPAPPGLPTLRAFQAAQGTAARKWVTQRTGWT